jgi:DNA-binding CsgD family transcriptional regulator
MESEPMAVLAENGLGTVVGARVSIEHTPDTNAGLDTQIGLWERDHATGAYVLYVRHTPQITIAELSDADLAEVSGAADGCCCNPCDSSPSLLTEREREVLNLVAEAYSNRQVGSMLGIREKTVKNHLHAIFGKLGVSSRTEAARYVYLNRLVGQSSG